MSDFLSRFASYDCYNYFASLPGTGSSQIWIGGSLTHKGKSSELQGTFVVNLTLEGLSVGLPGRVNPGSVNLV